MKTVVMLQGIGINERGWAMLASKYARVVLIQQGHMTHVEIWENNQRVFNGPNNNVMRWRALDDILLGLLSACHTFRLTLEHTEGRKINTIIAANYNTSFAALLLRMFGKTKTVVSFLTDYLPPCGPWHVRLHRRFTTILMKLASRLSDEVWTLSPRIHTGDGNPRHYVVPIFISHRPPTSDDRTEIAYIGYPSNDHALVVLFQIGKKHGFKINVIGDSPYLQSIKRFAPHGTVFHGLMNDEDRIGEILSKCFCGYCIYWDVSPNSYSYYGFPSKTLYCFANNVPIVITNAAAFNHAYGEQGVGRVVEPMPEKIEEAILHVRSRYPAFSKAIDQFRVEWNARVEAFHVERFAALGVIK